MPPIRSHWRSRRATAWVIWRSCPVIPLALIDLQAIKAAGVTFAVSLLERLIEEHSKRGPQPRREQCAVS